MKKLIGKRILFAVHVPKFDGFVFEGVVEGLSPSEKYVVISHGWYDVEKVNVLEELPDEEKEEKPKAKKTPKQGEKPAAENDQSLVTSAATAAKN